MTRIIAADRRGGVANCSAPEGARQLYSVQDRVIHGAARGIFGNSFFGNVKLPSPEGGADIWPQTQNDYAIEYSNAILAAAGVRLLVRPVDLPRRLHHPHKSRCLHELSHDLPGRLRLTRRDRPALQLLCCCYLVRRHRHRVRRGRSRPPRHRLLALRCYVRKLLHSRPGPRHRGFDHFLSTFGAL